MFKNRLPFYVDLVAMIIPLADGVGVVSCFDPDCCCPDAPFAATYPVARRQKPLSKEKQCELNSGHF